MKLHFESNLDFQIAAVESVCDLFRGQELCRTEFTVTRAPRATQAMLAGFEKSKRPKQLAVPGFDSDLGIGNRLQLLPDELLNNLRQIQLKNGLSPARDLHSPDFTIEMETGTGKTYVYLRTIFELNRRFGFTKFVIVVPSVAIKEGVYKTLQITEDHFRAIYANAAFEYFLYDSAKLGQVRNFATSPSIQIMVVTVGSINKKDVNKLYDDSEKTGGEKPIDLIKATRPVVIVDEPQSVDGGLEGSGKKALDAMAPLCTLRYSATHENKYHMVYRLDAVDAYERKLVKQIEVASLEVQSAHNKGYIKLISADNKNGSFSAKVEVDIQGRSGISRKELTVRPGDDLEQITKRDLYSNIFVKNIGCKVGEEYVEFSSIDRTLTLGDSVGDVDADALKRLMIKRTIEEHLDKELRLTQKGIKVLSLFFIDLVENYRKYDSNGSVVKGKYALMFEEEYRTAIQRPKYRTLFKDVDLETAPEDAHEGYFSVDRQKRWIDTSESNQTGRDNAERAYSLIMRDKEKLLSFQTKLKFIFSHSALKEGWDNPNVFQICAIRDIGTERERRQTIGRGLRICVDQSGERVRGHETNTLTVIATESYEEFAENLQREIEKDTGIRFGIVEKHQFASLPVITADGSTVALGVDSSEQIWTHLKGVGYLDSKGKVQDKLRKDLKENDVALPSEFEQHRAQIIEILRKLAGKLDVKNAADRTAVKTRQAVLESEEFRELWDRIKYRTTYRVHFDNEELIKECIEAVKRCPPITQSSVQIRKADLAIGRGGISSAETTVSAPTVLNELDFVLPDVVTNLQDRTQLTRRSVVRILSESGRLHDFARNPQQFIDLASEAITRTKRMALVDGIKYQKVGLEAYYAQELFANEELTGYLKNMVAASKSVYEYVVYDSAGVELSFAQELEKNEAVKVYAKLPGWFKVPTPLGSYNPDWAVLVEDSGIERLYFVVETKGSLFPEDMRDKESAKIACGRAHFQAFSSDENPAQYVVARNIDDFMAHCKKTE